MFTLKSKRLYYYVKAYTLILQHQTPFKEYVKKLHVGFLTIGNDLTQARSLEIVSLIKICIYSMVERSKKSTSSTFL